MSLNCHLWECQHEYDCESADYWNGKNKRNHKYKLFKDFLTDMGSSDFDLNLLFRWDWKENDKEQGKLFLYFLLQRKGIFISFEIDVIRDDELEVIEFLKPRWDHLKSLWQPFK